VATVLTVTAAHIDIGSGQHEPLGQCSLCTAAAQMVSCLYIVAIGLQSLLAVRNRRVVCESTPHVLLRERNVIRVRPPPIF
jgi:hypothetical protein